MGLTVEATKASVGLVVRVNAIVEIALSLRGSAADLDVPRYVMIVTARFLLADRAGIAALTLRRLVLMAFGCFGCICHV